MSKIGKPIGKWWMALIFAAFGYTLAVTVASPTIQSFLPFWAGVLAIPIVAVTSLAPVDPDAAMIYVLFGGSNAVLYGIVGLLIGDYIENHPRYDDKD